MAPVGIAVDVGNVLGFDTIGLAVDYYFPLQALFEGTTSVTLELQLPRHALVDSFKLRLQAKRVDSVQMQQVAQVRSYSQGGGNELVIDFGTPRTVSGVSLPSGVGVNEVYGWLGSQFNTRAAFQADGPGPSSAVFPELRTERLRVVLSAALSEAQLANARLHLPEPPSGLAITIDGGAPVWSHPEPVQPRAAETTPAEDGWDKESRRVVDLSAALAALTGDPLADEVDVAFQIKLSTAVPCILALTTEALNFRRIRRVRFGDQTSSTLDFSAEGQADLALNLPAPASGATRLVQQLNWVAEADLGPARTLPPVGPDAAPGEAGLPLAQALVGPEVSAVARLPLGTGLHTLQGIRLPLQALGDGAEARVVLWEAAPPEAGVLPGQPLPDGTSEPVTLASAPQESWVSFAFKKPLPLPTGEAAAMPWMALVVSRGQVVWGLAAASGNPVALVDQMRLRRGPPNGPWKALPAPLQSAGAVLDARARLRLSGLAPKDAPLAPLSLSLLGSTSSADLNPSAKGEPGSLSLGTGLASAAPLLRITSRVAGRLTLRDVDVISNV